MLDVLNSVFLFNWRRYDYVIFVRYLMGTAYLPSPIDKLAYHFFAAIVPKSERMFFLDIKPDVAYRRIVRRVHHSVEMFEKPDALEKIRGKGLALALLGKWVIVDGGMPAAEVELRIRNSLNPE